MQFLKAGSLDKGQLHESERGVAQGGASSHCVTYKQLKLLSLTSAS